MSITYILSGFAVGLLVGMTGVGGGSLMTPLLTLLFGVVAELTLLPLLILFFYKHKPKAILEPATEPVS